MNLIPQESRLLLQLEKSQEGIVWSQDPFANRQFQDFSKLIIIQSDDRFLEDNILGQIYEYNDKQNDQQSYILILQQINNDINCLKLLTICLAIFKNAYIYAHQNTVGLIQEFAQDIDSMVECFQLDESSYNALFNQEIQDNQNIQKQNARRIFSSLKEFKGFFDILDTDSNIKNIYYKLQLQICTNLLTYRIDELKAHIKQSPLTKQQFQVNLKIFNVQFQLCITKFKIQALFVYHFVYLFSFKLEINNLQYNQVFKNRILAEQFAEFHKENIEGNIQIIERFQKSLNEVKEYNTLLTNSKCSHLILKEFQFFENKKDQYQEYEEFEEDIDIFYQFYMENCPNFSNKKLIILEFLTKVLKEGAKEFIEKNIQQSKYLPLPAQINSMTNALAQEKEMYYENLMSEAQQQIEQLQRAIYLKISRLIENILFINSDIMSNRLLYEKNLEQLKEITSLEINELEEKIKLLETSTRQKDCYLRDSLNKHDKDKMQLEQKVHFQDIELMELRKKINSQISFNQFLNENKCTQTEEIISTKQQRSEDQCNVSIPSQNSQIPQRENRDELEGICDNQPLENSEQNIILNSAEIKDYTQNDIEKLLKEINDLTEYIGQRDSDFNNLQIENTNLQNEVSNLKDQIRVRNTQIQVTASCENLLYENFEEQKSYRQSISQNQSMITPNKIQDQQMNREKYSYQDSHLPQFGNEDVHYIVEELNYIEEDSGQIMNKKNIQTPELSSSRNNQQRENHNQIQQERDKVIQLEQYISELNQFIEQLKIEMKEQNEQIIRQQNEIQYLNQQQNIYEQEYENRQQEYKQQSQDNEIKQQEYERKIKQINENYAQQIQQEFQNLNEIISQKDEQYDDCVKSMKQQQKEIDDIKVQIYQKDNRLEENMKIIKKQQECLKEQEEQIKEKSEQIYQVFEQNQSLSNQNNQVQQELLICIEQKDQLNHILEKYQNKINQMDKLEIQLEEQNQFIEQQERALFEQQEHFSGQVQQLQDEVSASFRQTLTEKDEQIMNLKEQLQQSILIIQQLQKSIMQQDKKQQLESDKIQTINVDNKTKNIYQNNQQSEQQVKQKHSKSDLNGMSKQQESIFKQQMPVSDDIEKEQSRKEDDQTIYTQTIFEKQNQRYENNRMNIQDQKQINTFNNNIEEIEKEQEVHEDRYSLPVQTSNQYTNNDSNSNYRKDQKHEFSIMKLKDSYENGRNYSEQSTSQFKQQSVLYNPQKELSFQDNNEDLFISTNQYNQGLNTNKNSLMNNNYGITKIQENQNIVLEENQDNSIQDNSEKDHQVIEQNQDVERENVQDNKNTENNKKQFSQDFDNQDHHNEYRLNNNAPYFKRSSSNRSSSNSINQNKKDQQTNLYSQDQDIQQLKQFKNAHNLNTSSDKRYQLDFKTEYSKPNYAQEVTTTAPCITSTGDNEKLQFQDNIFKCFGSKRDYLTVPTEYSLSNMKSQNTHQGGMRQIQDQGNHNQSIKPIKHEYALHRVSSQNAQDFFQENLFEQIKHQKSDSYHPSPINSSKNRRYSLNSNLGITSFHEFDLKVVQSINEIPSPTYIAQKLFQPLIGQQQNSSDINKQNSIQQLNPSHSQQYLAHLQQQGGMKFDVNDIFEDIFAQSQSKPNNCDLLNKENKNINNILTRKIQEKKKEPNSLLQFENDLKALEENIIGQQSQNNFKNKFDINSLFNQKSETTINNRKKQISLGIFDSIQKKDFLGKNTLNSESARNQDQKNNKLNYGIQNNSNNNKSQITFTKANQTSNKILENKLHINLDSLSTQPNNITNFNTSRNVTPLNDRKRYFFQNLLSGFDDKQSNQNNLKNNNTSQNNKTLCSPYSKAQSSYNKGLLNQNAQPLLKEISTTSFQPNLNKIQSPNYQSISPLSVKNQTSRSFLKQNLDDNNPNKKQQTSFGINFNLKM